MKKVARMTSFSLSREEMRKAKAETGKAESWDYRTAVSGCRATSSFPA
jgi:hypothetical protein